MTKVIYESITSDGEFKLSVNCKNEREYLLAVENRKWLYPKIESMLFASECFVRADSAAVYQINKVLNKCVDDLLKLMRISKEENEMVR